MITRAKTTRARTRTKPPSDLQRLQSETTWLCKYRLQDIGSGQIPGYLTITTRLQLAIHNYTDAVYELRAAAKEAYTITKEQVLAARKKEIDEPKEK